jgi:hypothetical protein
LKAIVLDNRLRDSGDVSFTLLTPFTPRKKPGKCLKELRRVFANYQFHVWNFRFREPEKLVSRGSRRINAALWIRAVLERTIK